jgi:hypothetical protein
MTLSQTMVWATALLFNKERPNMCGIVGFLNKTPYEQTTVGQTILKMLIALGSRGPDSTGVALYGTPTDGGMVARVKLGEVRNGGVDFEDTGVWRAARSLHDC